MVMDGENARYHQNEVVAGPSTVMQDPSDLFLPPASDPQPPTFLASTQDLLACFHLHPAYNKHVQPPSPSLQPPLSTVAPKAIPHDPPPETDDKKKKNSYRHLIKNVPGKHSMKKDDFLTTTMLVPSKQRIAIVEFDARTQRDAFTVSAEGLKGWNAGTLIVESSQAKEDRKKRKELKKLARAQAQGVAPGAIPSTASVAPPPQFTPPNSTPSSAQQLPGSLPLKPRIPAVTISPASGQLSTTPTSATPRSAVPTNPPPWTTTPAIRGKKRELDDSVAQPAVSPTSSGALPSVVGAHAGVGTARPRPVKKQRTDIQGSWEIPVQQPTPQPT